MATEITENAIEESTYVFTVTFTDEDDNAVIPNTITWSLTDNGGTAINSRTDVSVSVPAAAIEITLSGDDLAIQAAEVNSRTVRRRLIVEATYDSDLGSDLPLNGVAVFKIENLVKIT